MSNRQSARLASLGLIVLMILAVCRAGWAQDGAELVAQLSGRTEGPQRDGDQLAQAYRKAVDYLLPLMSANDVSARYDDQIKLQDMVGYASRPGAEAERAALARVVVETIEQRDMPDTVRAWLVRQLERIGKAESLPLLTKLMSSEDEHLRDYARQALEKNPDSGATDILLEALATADEKTWRIGLIYSLGVRHAEAAVTPIAGALSDSDMALTQAAVTALAEIGGPDSIRALRGELESSDPLRVSKAAQGLVSIAQKMTQNDDNAGAARIYRMLYDWAAERDDAGATSIRVAAINGLAVCDPDNVTGRIVVLIRDSDPKLRRAAIEAARRSPSAAPTQVLTRVLGDLDTQSQVQVLGLLGERGGPDTIRPIQALLTSSDESVRLACVDALSNIGTVAGAEALMSAAVSDDRARQRAALAGLTTMPGSDVAGYIDAQARDARVPVRAAAIGLLGARGGDEAAEKLLAYATEDDTTIRGAAFDALVPVADDVDVRVLAGLVAREQSDSARAKGVTALKTVLAQATDKGAAADAVIGSMQSADAGGRIALLTSLNALGGAKALTVVVEATHSDDDALRDAAIRTLCAWPDFDAASLLIEVAREGASPTQHALATRGALRLIAAADSVPMDERVALCERILQQTQGIAESRQAISVLGTLPSRRAADRLLKLVQDEDLRGEAALAALQCAAGMMVSDRQAARALAQKIRDMDISANINRQADAVISGRGLRGMRMMGRPR